MVDEWEVHSYSIQHLYPIGGMPSGSGCVSSTCSLYCKVLLSGPFQGFGLHIFSPADSLCLNFLNFQSMRAGTPTPFATGGPLHTRDWEPATITLQALSLVELAEPVQVCFTLPLRDQRSMWMQDGCKVHMDSYMTLNGSCIMVTWTIFKDRLLEVGLTLNWESLALRTSTTIGLFYFIMCEDPHE